MDTIDFNGIELKAGDKVGTYDMNGKFYKGILKQDESCTVCDGWYVDYEDGKSCAVLEFSFLYKISEK